MRIGGLQKFSLIDYPGKIAAIVFTQGCNFRCPYCYNPELVDPDRFGECVPEGDVIALLEARRGKLDGVVITGGEPTLQPDLADFAARVKGLGYSVKLDTNGSNPVALKSMIYGKLADYIAMDIKAPLHPAKKPGTESRYGEVTRSGIEPEVIRDSIDIILSSGIDHEFRTTVAWGCLQPGDIPKMAKAVKGAKRYALQKFVPSKILDTELVGLKAPSDEELLELKKSIGRYVHEVIIR